VRRRVLVDHPVAAAPGAADEGVHLLARGLAGLRPAARTLERGERRAQEGDPGRVRAGYQLLERGDELGAARRVGDADVVDRVVGEDHPAHPRLLEHVPVEPVERALARAVGEQLVATDALVEHADRQTRGTQPLGQVVGPAAVVVLGGGDTVGDGGAQGDHGPLGGGVLHVQVGQEGVTAGRGRVGERGGGADIAAGHVVGLRALLVVGGGTGGLRQVEAHRDVGECRDGEGDRIADRALPGRDRHRGLTAEGDGPVGARVDRGARGAPGHVHVRDGQRGRAEGIGQVDAGRGPGDAGVHDLPQRLAPVRGAAALRRDGPGAGPAAGIGGGRRGCLRDGGGGARGERGCGEGGREQRGGEQRGRADRPVPPGGCASVHGNS